VNPERGSYYCFSSGQGGDHFTFIEKMEGVDFKGALKILAEKAGVEIVYSGSAESKASKDKLDRLREAMAHAEAYFARSLGNTTDAYAYATSRGLTPETISAWNLGLAPDGWRSLLESLTSEGFTVPELVLQAW
jgi:DNA primase